MAADRMFNRPTYRQAHKVVGHRRRCRVEESPPRRSMTRPVIAGEGAMDRRSRGRGPIGPAAPDNKLNQPAQRAVYTHPPTHPSCVLNPRLAGGFFLVRTAGSSAVPHQIQVCDMPKDVIITPEGLANLKAELDNLTTTRRREVAARIKEAREFGDISENAEYDDAKNEQAMLEARIASLEEKLRSATVIDQSDLSTDQVRVGSVVHVKDDGGKSTKYTIVGSAEASPARGEAVQRVAGRQGAARPQARRGGRDRHPEGRTAPQDHQDRRRVGITAPGPRA